MKFAQIENSGGSTYLPNLVFLGVPGANRQGVSYQRRVMEKGFAGRGLADLSILHDALDTEQTSHFSGYVKV